MEHIRRAVPRRRRSRATSGGAGEGGTSPTAPQKQHPWGSRMSPSTPSLSWVQGEVAPRDPRGDRDTLRWPWGQTDPCPSSHPLAKSHSQPDEVRKHQFSSGCWQSHQVHPMAPVSPRTRSHRHTQARLPVSPGRALLGSPVAGGRCRISGSLCCCRGHLYS